MRHGNETQKPAELFPWTQKRFSIDARLPRITATDLIQRINGIKFESSTRYFNVVEIVGQYIPPTRTSIVDHLNP